MGELAIRRNRPAPVLQYQGTGKAEKTSGTAQSRTVVQTAAFTISDTLRLLMDRMRQSGGLEGTRRSLQTGEAVLAEVQDSLDRMSELARESAGDGSPDRAALQKELEQLRDNISRMLSNAAVGGKPLFLDLAATGKDPLAAMPDWFLKGLAQDQLTEEQILKSLGLDKSATGADILAALEGRSLEDDPIAARLAVLYLGAVIAGAGSPEEMGAEQALNGLRLLIEKIAQGMEPDRAIELLSNNTFTGLADFQSQFTSGAAAGLEGFLSNLLLTGDSTVVLPDLSGMGLLAGMEGMKLELLMGLLANPDPAAAASQEAGGTASALAQNGPETASAQAAQGTAAEAPPSQTLQLGSIQVSGQDLSGVSYQASTGEITISGTADVVLQGTGQEAQTLRLTGSGTVTLQNVTLSETFVDSASARIHSAGKNELAQLQLREGSVLTLGGSGLLRLGKVLANHTNRLSLTGGAVVVNGRGGQSFGTLSLPVYMEGTASLAAHASQVFQGDGKALAPFDVVWKALLPGWSGIHAMSLNGGELAKMALLNGHPADPIRLWLNKENTSQGYPFHTLLLQGRDEAGRTRTRYTYLHWNHQTGAFQEEIIYPNPFTVIGGEPGQDWVYEEETHTLHILSAQVTAISGGPGVDLYKTPFSGRIALADHIGAIELTLDGVVCQVSSGRAFHLGRENEVALVLRQGTSNIFESGAGCAGISLGEGASLRIDRASQDNGQPAGTLTATIGVGVPGAHGDILTMQMEGEAVTRPQFCLSSRVLQLDRLSVSTREAAQAAQRTVNADRRWVAQVQAAYSTLYRQYLDVAHGLVRDPAAAGALLQDILLQPRQAIRTHGKGGSENAKQLF